MARRGIRFTEEDYNQLPEDWHAELIEGELVMSPAPDPSHERLVSGLLFMLAELLGENARDRVLGSRVDIRIDRHNIVQPDVVVLPEGTTPTPHPWKIPTPIWVAEVLSPGTVRRDRGVKLRLYARKGIREAWLVDPRRNTIESHDLATGESTGFAEGETATARVIPGFAVDIDRFFSF